MRRSILIITLCSISALIASCDGGTGNANVPKNTSANNTAATTAPAANNEADVKKLIADLAAALGKNDVAALDKIYGDDYMLVQQDGTIATKAERIAAIKSGDLKFENVAFNNVKVRSYGDSAVALCDSSGKSMNKGKEVTTSYRITFVAHKGKDGWHLVSAQLAPMPEAAKTDDKKPVDANVKKEDDKKDDMKKDEPKTEDKKQ
jgi:ketosteroid isomerase-like protein